MSPTTRHSQTAFSIHKVRRGLAWLLFVVLLLQPTTPAFAQVVDDTEGSEEVAATTTDSIDEEKETVSPDDASDSVDVTTNQGEDKEVEENIADDPAPDDRTDPDDPIVAEVPAARDVSSSTPPTDTDDGSVSTTTEPQDEEVSVESQASSSPTGSTTTPIDVATSSEDASNVQDDEIASSTEIQGDTSNEGDSMATTSPATGTTTADSLTDQDEIQSPADELPLNLNEQDEVATSAPSAPVPVNVVFNDENLYSFSRQQCVNVGDGSFYCTDEETDAPIVGTDRVFAATDSEGDREIYVEFEGETIKLTDNKSDDNAPFYDALSETIVWHRLIDGRYQIISYDVSTSEETQLTSGRENNMQPSRSGELTVWQTWDNGDWDIVLLEDNERRLLTENGVHDISPRINGTYVVWQSFEDNAWVVKVYDRKTDTIDSIEAGEGGSVENPRFVLVYDRKMDNGDIETKGYDLDSGEVVPLSSTPVSVPVNIPDPEQTGQDRALVAPSVNIKTKSQNEHDDNNNDIDLNSGTTSEKSDIIVTPYVENSSTSTVGADVEAAQQNASSSNKFDVTVVPAN